MTTARLDAAVISARAAGRWREVLPRLGVDLPATATQHGPCPACGGKDRFRFDDQDGRGTWFCNQCQPQAGDGFHLVQNVRGCDFPHALQMVADALGERPSGTPPSKQTAPILPTDDKVRTLWQHTTPDTGRLSRYLQSRGLSGTVPEVLRLHVNVNWWEGSVSLGAFPAMVAQIQDVDGQALGLHVTALATHEEGKAKVPQPKKTRKFQHVDTITGGAIHLGTPRPGAPLLLAEGIETALALAEATGWPAWACVSANGLDAVQVPPTVSTVLIGADLDTSEAGHKAAVACEDRLRKAGHTVAVMLPPGPIRAGEKSQDWLDVFIHHGPDVVKAAGLQALAPTSTTETQEQTLARLATLSPLEYGQCREREAKRLGVALKFLDQAIRDRKKSEKATRPGQGRVLELEDVIPWESPVDGVDLVRELVATHTRYVHVATGEALTCALWEIRAHAHECFDFNPRLAALSPEKGCGKTTLLDLVSYLVPRPLCTSNISPASVFRVIETAQPSLLMDEMDSFHEAHEELRGILNSGHTRVSATIVRTVGDDHEPRMFSTWCPMMCAAIGRLPSTLEDRSLVIPMQRCTRAERDKLAHLWTSGKRGAGIQAALHALARKMARWVLDHTEALQEGDPLVPDGLSLRAGDNWRPLLTIAEIISPETATEARAAALSISGSPDALGETAGIQLLSDLHTLTQDADGWQMSSQALCDTLAGLEERPWGDWKHGKPLSQNQLAKLLKPFRISSRNLKQPDGAVLKGYALRDLTDAFGRYLPVCVADKGISKRYAATSRSQSGDESLFQSATEEDGSGSENARNPAPRAEGSAVAFPTPETPSTYATEGLWEGAEEVDADAP